MKLKKSKKVIVALSGGVDSAVTAALLKKQGFDVIGVHFWLFGKTWKPNFQVKEIARKLEIPLEIVDARKEFKKKIINYFVSAYKNGLTPNPCVVCNKEMKFRLLFDLLKKYKADYVATGHYACVKRETKNQKSKTKNKEDFFHKLLEAEDKQKDQSYFLYRLAQKDLAKIIFPLGGYKKSEVKKMAKKIKLPVAKNESQDICFLSEEPVNDFLKKRVKWEKGKIRDMDGKYSGMHQGLPFYTLGQRKGIEIGGTGPYYVIGKNIRKNELYVTNDSKKLLTKRFHVGRVNWIKPGIKFPLRAEVQIRYHAPKVSAIIKPQGKKTYSVELAKPLRAITPGQSAVFYKGEEVSGGGTIIS